MRVLFNAIEKMASVNLVAFVLHLHQPRTLYLPTAGSTTIPTAGSKTIPTAGSTTIPTTESTFQFNVIENMTSIDATAFALYFHKPRT